MRQAGKLAPSWPRTQIKCASVYLHVRLFLPLWLLLQVLHVAVDGSGDLGGGVLVAVVVLFGRSDDAVSELLRTLFTMDSSSSVMRCGRVVGAGAGAPWPADSGGHLLVTRSSWRRARRASAPPLSPASFPGRRQMGFPGRVEKPSDLHGENRTRRCY